MWSSIILVGSVLLCTVQCLKPFDPWASNNSPCAPSMKACKFHLEASTVMTMFYKQLFRVVATPDGTLEKYNDENRTFSVDDVITGDGYPKLAYVLNNSLPGPVLHVYQGQRVSIDVLNHMPTESLSVHFHGIRQVGTPQSDGVGHVTQLSILPGHTYHYEFTVDDEGTFWYHSHMKSQTAMGLIGALIVHPRKQLSPSYEEFTLVLQDWQHLYTGEQHQLLVESGQFFPNNVLSIVESDTIDYYQAVDGSRAAEALVTSILVNGRGQYFDPENNTSSSTPFERVIVNDKNSSYRFRLINGGIAFSLVFSIDEHKIQVISSDGIPFWEPKLVDKLIIGLGERYDVIVNISNESTHTSWWIRVDTMDMKNNPRWHGRAILQIGNNDTIQPTTPPRSCTQENLCYIVNCPFSQYGSDLNTICLTMQNISSDSNHIDKELVSESAHVAIKEILSLTVVEGTDEEAGYESINYRSMLYPILEKPIIYNAKEARERFSCASNVNRETEPEGRKCYHHIVAKYNDIVEFLIVNPDSDQHPIHMHGTYFHIIEQGLAQLNHTTGIAIGANPNVVCDEEGINCKCVNCSINTQVVKDTMIVPSTGYMRIRFRANNPGVWLLHCHTEPHLDRGMALAIHVAEDRLATLWSPVTSMGVTNIVLSLLLNILCILISI